MAVTEDPTQRFMGGDLARAALMMAVASHSPDKAKQMEDLVENSGSGACLKLTVIRGDSPPPAYYEMRQSGIICDLCPGSLNIDLAVFCAIACELDRRWSDAKALFRLLARHKKIRTTALACDVGSSDCPKHTSNNRGRLHILLNIADVLGIKPTSLVDPKTDSKIYLRPEQAELLEIVQAAISRIMEGAG